MLSPTVQDRSLRRVLHRRHEEVNADALAADRRRINQDLETTLRESLGCVGSPESSHAADVYLRLRVTDYGETPRRWAGAYVTFEVVSTLAIAAGFYVHAVTRPVAGAYLLEESIEEFSEGYAGFWALNRLSRPVRIEADLIDGPSGRVLWRGAHTGLAHWRWRNLRHMDDAVRDTLLAVSMRKAVKAFSGVCSQPGKG